MVEETPEVAKSIDSKLRESLEISELHIKDVSGGCG